MIRSSHQGPAGTLAIAALLVTAACATDSIAGPDAGALSSPSGAVVVATPQTITVCKAASSPAGTYDFSVGATTGSANPGDSRVSLFSLTIPTVRPAGDICTTVFTRTQAQTEFSDAPAFVAVTEGAAPGTTLSAINATSTGEAPVVNVPGRSVRLAINAFHGSRAVFVNVAVPKPCPDDDDDDDDSDSDSDKDSDSDSDKDSDRAGKSSKRGGGSGDSDSDSDDKDSDSDSDAGPCGPDDDDSDSDSDKDSDRDSDGDKGAKAKAAVSRIFGRR